MNYDLTQLTEWVRRLARDKIAGARETFTSDGTGEIDLAATGYIVLTSVKVDGDDMDITQDVSVEVRTLIFDDPQDAPDGSVVVARYNNAGYSDDEIGQFLVDAAKRVGGDLSVPWLVNPDTFGITDIPDIEFVTIGASTVLLPLIENLIAMRAGANAYAEKANRASDDAIMVKDGDTLIDTSKAALAGKAALERMETDYASNLAEAMTRRQKGAGWSGS